MELIRQRFAASNDTVIDTTITVSVIICTHNPRLEHLRRVLDSLRGQTLAVERWELLVIDNASKEPLTGATCDLSWHQRARIVREEELGLSAARIRGIQEAAAQLLVFVDDDNVLDENYLTQALMIGDEWPQLGVWGGSILPEFEIEPPDHLREFMPVREIQTPLWSNIASKGADPWGAGLCVRAKVAAEYRLLYNKSRTRISGRLGNSLLAGEDTEICYAACRMGLGMGLFPALRLLHLIPKERVNEDYAIRFVTGTHTSLCIIDYKWHGIVPSSPYTMMNMLRVCKQLLFAQRFQRRIILARLRATAAARRTIAASENQTSLA